MPVLAPPHLDDHESQLALQQEKEALANAVGGVPSLGTGRGRLGSLSGPTADKLRPRARCPKCSREGGAEANSTAWKSFAWR